MKVTSLTWVVWKQDWLPSKPCELPGDTGWGCDVFGGSDPASFVKTPGVYHTAAHLGPDPLERTTQGAPRDHSLGPAASAGCVDRAAPLNGLSTGTGRLTPRPVILMSLFQPWTSCWAEDPSI